MRKVLLLLLIACLLSGCAQPGIKTTGTDTGSIPVGSTSEIEPKYTASNGFNFILAFGVGAKNVLNTFEGTFTKDLVQMGTKTAELKLTANDMDEILSQMKKIDIFSYPDIYDHKAEYGPITIVTPCNSYYLFVNLDGKQKKISWKDENMASTEKANALRNLLKKIESMLFEKKEYKDMPEAVGGYD